MGVWLGPMTSPVSFISQTDFTYTDKENQTIYAADNNNQNWEIAFLATGTLKFLKNPGKIDVFLVGSGLNGNNSSFSWHDTYGKVATAGTGGNAGAVIIQTGVPAARKKYYIKIGTPTGQVDTEGFGFIASNGAGNSGGTGAWCASNDNGKNGNNGTGGTLAFNEEGTLIGSNTRYGASGPGGGAGRANTSGKVEKSAGTRSAESAGTGGGVHTSQTQPETSYADSGGDASPNTGCGGGGSGAVIFQYNNTNVWQEAGSIGGAGSSGIIIIRNHRTS